MKMSAYVKTYKVSTHSRPKAAAHYTSNYIISQRFNTQPPEGGCTINVYTIRWFVCFNTQPPEGGCPNVHEFFDPDLFVSTHSRPKAAD